LLPESEVKALEGRKWLGWLKGKEKINESAAMTASAMEMPSGTGARTFVIVTRPGQHKLTFIANSPIERDEWIGAIKGVLIASMATETNSPSPPPVATTSRVIEQNDAETITCAGIVVMDGRCVARIKAGASGNPFTRQVSSIDSIVGQGDQSLALLSSPHEQLDELNHRYQQAIIDRSKAEKERDILRLELQICKLVGQFHTHVAQYLRRIVDEYHQSPRSPLGGTRFEDGPLRILFIADYSQANEEVVAGAYAWLRQELNAVRWLNRHRKAGILQPLMTVAEYKGFRALAMLALPLGEKTLVMEPISGLVDEAAIMALVPAIKELNLAAFPHRTADGRLLQLPLPPAIEVHRLVRAHTATKEPVSSALYKEKKQLQKEASMTTSTPAGLYLANVHDLMPPYPSSEDVRGLLFFRREHIEKINFAVSPGDLAVLKALKECRLPQVISELESLQLLPLDSEEWRTLLHNAGLNVALLGAIAQETKLPHVREGSIIEMIARTAKIVLRSRIRGAILHFRDVQAVKIEEELVATVLEIVNGILQSDPQWMDELLAAVEDRFGYHIEGETALHLPRNALLMALSHHCALNLKESAYARTGPIDGDDFVGFTVQLTDGGAGCFASSLDKNDESEAVVEMAKIILPAGESLWAMVGQRAAASRAICKLVEQKISQGQWDEALRYADLASGLCPRAHPQQILISLALAAIRTKGPPNLAFRPPVLGEKGQTNGNTTDEELKRITIGLLHRVERHFGAFHPLGIQVRIRLANLMESVSSRAEALTLRSDSLIIAHKVLGRRHPFCRTLLVDLAESHRLAQNYDEAITAYEEALKQEESAFLMSGVAKCWQAKGDYELALEWSLKCRTAVEVQQDAALLEEALERIAFLSQHIFLEDSEGAPLPALLAEEILPEPIAKHLHMAVSCYETLFDMRRNRHDLNTADGEALLRLVRRIVLLTLRLSSAAQRPVIRAAIRKKLFQRPAPGELAKREVVVRELLVRMVAGPATPKEITEKVLTRVASVETLPEAENELGLLLDLIELVS
jgi:tetratricopeptide (TPR) repeat protein